MFHLYVNGPLLVSWINGSRHKILGMILLWSPIYSRKSPKIKSFTSEVTIKPHHLLQNLTILFSESPNQRRQKGHNRASQFAESALNFAPRGSFAHFFKVIIRCGLLFLIGSGLRVNGCIVFFEIGSHWFLKNLVQNDWKNAILTKFLLIKNSIYLRSKCQNRPFLSFVK